MNDASGGRFDPGLSLSHHRDDGALTVAMMILPPWNLHLRPILHLHTCVSDDDDVLASDRDRYHMSYPRSGVDGIDDGVIGMEIVSGSGSTSA